MKKEINTDRIIGDCMEVYGEIVSMLHDTSSKEPRFIREIKAKRYLSKLVKIVKKIRDANKPLNKENLKEYFYYLFSSFPPYGSYKNTTTVNILESTNTVMAVFKLDIYTKIKFVIRDNDDMFNMIISKKSDKSEEVNSYDINTNELLVENKEIASIIEEINKTMLDNITEYILSSIKLSTKGNEV